MPDLTYADLDDMVEGDPIAARDRVWAELQRLHALAKDGANTTGADRLPPAVDPDGRSVDHDCAFRRMLRNFADTLGVQPTPSGNYDARDIDAALAAISTDTLAEQLRNSPTRWDEHSVADQVTRLAYVTPGFQAAGHSFGDEHVVVLRRGDELWEVTATAQRLDDANAQCDATDNCGVGHDPSLPCKVAREIVRLRAEVADAGVDRQTLATENGAFRDEIDRLRGLLVTAWRAGAFMVDGPGADALSEELAGWSKEIDTAARGAR